MIKDKNLLKSIKQAMLFILTVSVIAVLGYINFIFFFIAIGICLVSLLVVIIHMVRMMD